MENKIKGQVNYNKHKIDELVKQNKNLKLMMNAYRKRAVQIIAVSVAFGTIIGGTIFYKVGKNNEAKQQYKERIESILLDDYVSHDIEVIVTYDDTISEIAQRYYSSEWDSVYGNFANFQEKIKEKSGLKTDRIEVGDTLIVPIIVKKDNIYYREMNAFQYQIDEIKNNENEYWVSHIVGNETLSELASRASGSGSETLEIIEQIKNKNGKKTDTLYPGEQLQIVNPKLGNLKMALNEVEKELIQSVVDEKNQNKTR